MLEFKSINEQDSAYIMDNNTLVVYQDANGASWNIYLTEGGTYFIPGLFLTSYNLCKAAEEERMRSAPVVNGRIMYAISGIIKPTVQRVIDSETGRDATIEQIKEWVNNLKR